MIAIMMNMIWGVFSRLLLLLAPLLVIHRQLKYRQPTQDRVLGERQQCGVDTKAPEVVDEMKAMYDAVKAELAITNAHLRSKNYGEGGIFSLLPKKTWPEGFMDCYVKFST